jgi:hypothetical protein
MLGPDWPDAYRRLTMPRRPCYKGGVERPRRIILAVHPARPLRAPDWVFN